MTTDENLSELQSKHNRLISDYKNLRDKHNVLKNALTREREKFKDLEALFVGNDIQSRKLLQEIDSLKFRNDMLTKQINTLREDLENEKQIKSSKRSTFKSQIKSESSDVFKEELLNKIDECSHLHSQLSNLKAEYQMETNNFRSAINDLENQLKLVKSQSNNTELNIRKALANEIEERTALELKLENKETVIQKLANSEQCLLQEVYDLKQKLFDHSISPSASLICTQKDNQIDLDNYSVKSKDLKGSENLNESMSSLPNNDNLNTNEVYTCSLIDKIGQLEQKIIVLEMENQLAMKRQQIEKMHRDLYEEYIINKGDKLPQLEQPKPGLMSIIETDSVDHVVDKSEFVNGFYKSKIASLNKMIYQSIAKAALYFDEAKVMESRLEIERRENSALRDEIDAMKQRIISCQEDLDLTRIQYENKMKEISIHIVELNTQIENKKMASQRNQFSGDHSFSGHENISTIKGFINALKK